MAFDISKLRTGDVVRVPNVGSISDDAKWGVLFYDKSISPHSKRADARDERYEFSDDVVHSRLAKLLKVTGKTITVEITK